MEIYATKSCSESCLLVLFFFLFNNIGNFQRQIK